MNRCPWCGQDELYIRYHDTEWGKPQKDTHHLFAMLNLEGAQAGLSWITILRRREHYMTLFNNFDPDYCANLTDDELTLILKNPLIIRNRLKIYGVRKNAQAYLNMKNSGLDFSEYVWSFVNGKQKINMPKSMKEVLSQTPESDAMSKSLKKYGFTFVGSTICYAFMQAVGMVNDHLSSCDFR